MNRRGFIDLAAATLGSAFLLPPVVRASIGADGSTYAPQGKPNPVVQENEFIFGAAHLDHGHIYGMCNGLIEAGAVLKWVYEPDEKRRHAFLSRYPQAKAARTLDEILLDPTISLVAAAAVTSERGPLGCQVMNAGKDYFTDKAPFTRLDQLSQARSVVKTTGRKYMVYYSERLHVEAAMHATDLVRSGAVGRVIQVIGLGPHRLSKESRPAWFFEREKYGGILCDIGSHQFEQFLTYAGATDATVVHSAVANFANPERPEFEDFGIATLVADNGATNQIRVDWFTPDGLANWGDGRTFILGTKGYMELRKYVDVGRDAVGNHVYLVDDKGAYHIPVDGKVGYRFFGELVLDCLNRTEKAMTQSHVFKAAELCLLAQAKAQRLTGAGG